MTLRHNPRIDGPSSLDHQAIQGPISPSDTAIAIYGGRELQPNRGVPLNLDWVNAVRVNTSAVERRAQTIGTRRTVKKDWQAAWLLRAITCMDLTTLSGDDTDERVRRLCAKARQPIVQFSTDLPVGPDEEDCALHRFTYWGKSSLSAASRTGYLASFSDTRGFGTPQEMAKPGSLQRMPCSSPGS